MGTAALGAKFRAKFQSKVPGTSGSLRKAVRQVKIIRMRCLKFIAALSLLALAASPLFAASDASMDTPIISCGNGVPGGISCTPSKKDEKEARTAYARGLKLEEHKKIDQAFLEFDEASRLVSEDTKFFAAREVAKSQLVFQHTERGDALLADGQRDPAVAEYRSALKLDPDNDYLQSRLAQALRLDDATNPTPSPLVAESAEIHLRPKPEVATFHYSGDVRGLFTELASAYGVTAEFDDSVLPMTVRFYVDDVDFFTALNLACRVSKTMWSPLDTHQLLIAKNTPENHKQFDRMSLATFAAPGGSTPQEATELVSALRNICEFQRISPGQNGVLEVRAPRRC